MKAKLIRLAVGPWPMNCYIVICEQTGHSAIIDPGADGEKILTQVGENQVDAILLTHAHFDHVQALSDVKQATGAPVYLHPADGRHFSVRYDQPLHPRKTVLVGNLNIQVVYTPGHTPGQCCFDLGDGRVIVGDTIFHGGPGKTASPEDFKTTMQTMQETVFQWSDETEFFPGHGDSSKIGIERPAFDAFVARGWPEDLHGDVTWAS